MHHLGRRGIVQELSFMNFFLQPGSQRKHCLVMSHWSNLTNGWPGNQWMLWGNSNEFMTWSGRLVCWKCGDMENGWKTTKFEKTGAETSTLLECCLVLWCCPLAQWRIVQKQQRRNWMMDWRTWQLPGSATVHLSEPKPWFFAGYRRLLPSWYRDIIIRNDTDP